MGHLAPGEIFENPTIETFWFIFWLNLKKWLLSYRNSDISYRDAWGFGDMLPAKILK